MPELRTTRLQMRSFTLELMQTALRDKTEFARLIRVNVPLTWPGPDYAEALPFFIKRFSAAPTDSEWIGLIIHSADQTLIGDMGFKGPPDASGTVEIGYSIVPEYRRHGYATEMAEALVAWALGQPEVRRVTAECLPDNAASIRVLEKLGMRLTGEVEGMLRWERSRTDQA